MTKNNRWFILAVASIAALLIAPSAFAAFQVPSVPKSLPGVAVPAVLPGRSMPGKGAMPAMLPVLPIPAIPTPAAKLPGPLNPFPMKPTVVFAGVKQFAGAAETPKEPLKGEKLDQIFDKGVKKDDAVRGSNVYKIPESDLIDELGIE